MPISETEVARLAKIASRKEKADIYIYNGPIHDSGFAKLMRAVSKTDGYEKAVFMITTYGGNAEAAFRIARWMQRIYKQFVVFPTSICASAGTLIAVGGTQLIMSPFSELGPLDVQQNKRDEIGASKSGLVMKAALDALREQSIKYWEEMMMQIKIKSDGNVTFGVCAEIASGLCGKLFAESYKQIDPEILGEDERDLKIALEYGRRLADFGGNISHEKINVLVNDYPSHNFVIDSEESNRLFTHVNIPSNELNQLAVALKSLAFNPIKNEDRIYVARLNDELEQGEETDDDEGGRDDKASAKAA